MKISLRSKEGYIQTAKILKGSERRLFMARVVKMLGPGGQRYAERELGWNRATIRKGLRELESGRLIRDNFSARGRRRAEERLPNLMADLREVIEAHGQLNPRSDRIQLSSSKIRSMLIQEKGYSDMELPTMETIRKKVHDLGYKFSGQGWDDL